MPDVYVYAPLSGQITGLDDYCSGGTHRVAKLCCPIDIGVGEGTSVYFYGSGVIKSVRTTYQGSGVCLDGTVPEPWDAGVLVEFFGNYNAQCPIGEVFFAHTQQPVSDGVYNTNSIQVGVVPPNTCGCDCYGGCHSHVERDANGTTNTFGCGNPVYAGSTWMYRWYWNEGYC